MIKRKAMRVQSDDESEGESIVPVKRSRVDELPAESEEELIDVETPEAPSRLRRQSSPSKRPSKSTTKAPPAKKRKRAIGSDAGSEDDFFNDAVDSGEDDEPPPEEYDDGDDDFVVDDAPKRGKAKSTGARGKGRSRAADKEDTKDIKMKDERQQKPPPAKRARPAEVDAAALVAPEPGPSVVSVKGLPRIKKNNSSASTVPGTPSNPAAAKPAVAGKPPAPAAKAAALDLKKDLGLKTSSRKAAATQPASDLDLNNKDNWASLFKGGTGPPRAGVKNDDGRKELEKKREAERARRMESLRNTFDLQAQTEKIIRFEERLRTAKSGVAFPKFLAAKWRDVYERGKKPPAVSANGTPQHPQSSRTPQHNTRTPQHMQNVQTPQQMQTPQYTQIIQTPQHSQHVQTPRYSQDLRTPQHSQDAQPNAAAV